MNLSTDKVLNVFLGTPKTQLHTPVAVTPPSHIHTANNLTRHTITDIHTTISKYKKLNNQHWRFVCPEISIAQFLLRRVVKLEKVVDLTWDNAFNFFVFADDYDMVQGVTLLTKIFSFACSMINLQIHKSPKSTEYWALEMKLHSESRWNKNNTVSHKIWFIYIYICSESLYKSFSAFW